MESWFSRGIRGWYKDNKRDLPWRKESDPYRIWLSEVILQQTQVVQGQSYYVKFIQNYPTIKHLAAATEDKVMKDWQGLGYYSRARNLHAAAKAVAGEKKGVFPHTFEEIRKLKGVGDYTAAAIASFAYNLPYAVVDGNVYRVLSRVFGIDVPIDSTDGKKKFIELAQSLLDVKDPATHNQAIMEFGSQFCKPVNPNCQACIFRGKCDAFLSKRVDSLPVKAKKTKVSNRYFNYLVIIDKDNTILLNKRSASDIWKGLYEFKLIETDKETDAKKLFTLPDVKQFIKPKSTVLHASKTYKHILSHQHLFARFYVVKINSSFSKENKRSTVKTLTKYAFPRLIEKFLNDCNLSEIV
ncbi:MAG: mutY [Bacteroidetes bacterium]|jgi:A/G-specific adenine glycosylase|nr:mutY [Bacteroidota bacterium]